MVPAELPVQNRKDFIALARRKPGRLNYGSARNGSAGQLASGPWADLCPLLAQKSQQVTCQPCLVGCKQTVRCILVFDQP